MADDWLSRINFTPNEFLHADNLNFLALDDRNWGGNVNAGGHVLSNVILQGSGSFEFYASPVQITATSALGAGTSATLYSTQTPPAPIARWATGKDGATETGGNAGSNYIIRRFSDAGAAIDTPFSINRQTGVITMGAQFWTGPINANGQTLSGAVIPGVLADPTTAKGDVLARSASALARVPVGADGNVLMADSAQLLGVKWAPNPGAVSSVFGRTGAIVATPNDYTAAQVTNAVSTAVSYSDPAWITSLAWSKIAGAPVFALASVNVFAGTGMTGGGPLTADVTLNAKVTSVNARIGDVVVTAEDIAGVGGVTSTRKVIAGAGMTGGGELSADVTLNANVVSVFGRSGAVALGSADIAAAGGVLQTRTILPFDGTLTGGGDLSQNRTFAVAPNTSLQKVAVSSGGTLGGTRKEINFLGGANITVSVNDIAGGDRVDVAIASTAGPTSGPVDPTAALGDLIVRGEDVAPPGSPLTRLPLGADGDVLAVDLSQPLGLRWSASAGGEDQTPWTQDINAAGFSLSGVGSITAASLIRSTGSGIGYPDDTFQATAGVLPSRQVLAGAGMTGGGTLDADVTLNANVLSVQGRIGAVTLSAADIISAGGVPNTRQVLAGAGMSGGGALTADVTLNANVLSVNGRTGAVVITAGDVGAVGGMIDPTTTKGDLIARSATAPSRLPIGANGQVLVADSAQALGVKWSTGGGQTPWASDIDGAGFRLLNAGNIGVGTGTVPLGHTLAGRAYLTVKGSTDIGVLEMATAAADADGSITGLIVWTDPANSQADKRVASIYSARTGATANNRGGYLGFGTRPDAGATPIERMRIDRNGNVGIGAANPGVKLAVEGGRTTVAAASESYALGIYNSAGGTPFWIGAEANGALRLSEAGGTGRMYITQAGNVGIGTAGPGTPLHVVSVANDVLHLQTTGAATATYLTFTNPTGATTISNGAGGNLYLGGGSSAGILHFRNLASFGVSGVFSSTGAFGINTSSPATEAAMAKLAVVGVAAQRAGSLAESNTKALVSFRPDLNSGYTLAVCSEVTYGFPTLQGVNWNGGAASASMLLQPFGGNVGIGTSNPAAPLHVFNSGVVTKLVLGRNDGAVAEDTLLRINTAGASNFAGIGFDAGAATDGAVIWRRTNLNGIALRGQTTLYSQLMTITPDLMIASNGNVGIATLSPSYKLQVAGGRAVFTGASEHYNIGVQHSAAGPLYWIGCDASGNFALCDAPGNTRLYMTQAGNLWCGGTITAGGFSGSGIGGGVTVQTTPARAINTVYQNTTGKPMYVRMWFSTTTGTGVAYCDTNSSPGTAVCSNGASGGGSSIQVGISFWVLPNYYYKVITAGATATLSGWVEWY